MLCYRCAEPIHGIVCRTDTFDPVHWGCAQWNTSKRQASISSSGLETKPSESPLLRSSFYSNDPAGNGIPAIQLSSSEATSVSSSSWLEPLLASLGLSSYMDSAELWCQWTGVACTAELIGNWDDFVEYLQLEDEEQERFAHAYSQALSFLGDVVEHSKSSTSAPGGAPVLLRKISGCEHLQTQVHGLKPWLESLHLSSYFKEAIVWCESMGAVDIEEVEENWEDLAEYLQLTDREHERLSIACGRSTWQAASSSGNSTCCDQLEEEPETQADVKTFGPSDAPYTMFEQLGRGATATVYRCQRGEDHFAVKVMNLEKLRMNPQSQRILQTLSREAQLFGTLRHEKIVRLHDVIETDQQLFLVMDLLTGGELFDYIASRGSMSETESRYVFVQVVDALKYLHSKNIVHRDLKPDNILIDSRDPRSGLIEVKLSDFGHSKFIRDGYTRALTVCGTPQYWAPEVADALSRSADGYNEKVDLWSLGIVLYVMLVGYYPFRESTITRDTPFPFRGSREAEEIVRGLIRYKPEERMSLDQCLQCPWVTKAQLGLVKRGGITEQEKLVVRVRLPNAPQDVCQLKQDLISYSRKHKVFAALQLLEVLVSASTKQTLTDDALLEARNDLEKLLILHFPELKSSNVSSDLLANEDNSQPDLVEERMSLEAIYGGEFMAISGREWRVQLADDVAVLINIPGNYPRDCAPGFVIESVNTLAPPGLSDELNSLWTAGESCVYQCVEYVRETLDSFPLRDNSHACTITSSSLPVEGYSNLKTDVAQNNDAASRDNRRPLLPKLAASPDDDSGYRYIPGGGKQRGEAPRSVKRGQHERKFGEHSADPRHEVSIKSGEPLVVKKSTFQAHMARVASFEQVSWVHRHLLCDKRISTATHNVIAYRIAVGPETLSKSDFDDDNEPGAGKYLLAILEGRHVDNLFVMVSRWYGGVDLGPGRFKAIKEVARSILDQEGVGQTGKKHVSKKKH